MSRAIELAEKHGLCEINDHGQAVTDYGDSTADIEAFYHAARAEVLREAAEFIKGQEVMTLYPTKLYSAEEVCSSVKLALRLLHSQLRAMADREEKQ